MRRTFNFGFVAFILWLVAGCGGAAPMKERVKKPPVMFVELMGNLAGESIANTEQSMKYNAIWVSQNAKAVSIVDDPPAYYYRYLVRCPDFFEAKDYDCVPQYVAAVYVAEVYLGPEELKTATTLLYEAAVKMSFEGLTPDGYFLAARVARLFNLGREKEMAAAKRDITWWIEERHDTKTARNEVAKWGLQHEAVADSVRRHVAWLLNDQHNPNEALAEVIQWNLGQTEVDLVCSTAKQQQGTYANSWHRDPFLLRHCGGPVTEAEAQAYQLQPGAKDYLRKQDWEALTELTPEDLARFARVEMGYCYVALDISPTLEQLSGCLHQYSIATAVQANEHVRKQVAWRAFQYGISYMKLSLANRRLFADVDHEARVTAFIAHKEQLGEEALSAFIPVYYQVHQLPRQ